jgi:MFS transporter, ACDE family, multidrug resistance protein
MSTSPRAVWAVAFACVTAFMGIGLVDPILISITTQLHASPSQSSLMFTGYMAVMGLSMLVTGWVSTRLGAKRTLLLGLGLIVVATALAGASHSVTEVIAFRGVWGLGNALFIATALSAIVAASGGQVGRAIILYEAALGAGFAFGPLLGGLLGQHTWRAPFFGVAVLMTLGLATTAAFLPTSAPTRRTALSEPIRALRHPALALLAAVALFYNLGFFTLLASGPFALPSFGVMDIGWTFFGWGSLLAIASVWGAPALQRRFGTAPVLLGALGAFTADFVVMASWSGSEPLVATGVILAGACLGVINTLITEAVMHSAPVDRPIASAAYLAVRFSGGAVGPYVAMKLFEHQGTAAPFWFGAIAVGIGWLVLAAGRHVLSETPAESGVELLEDVLVSD